MKMDLKLKSIYKMNLKKALILLSIVPLSSCGNNILNRPMYLFSTECAVTLYSGQTQDLDNIEKILTKLDKLSDNFKARDVQNIYKINQTNEEIEVDSDLYNLLKIGDELTKELDYFNIYCGGLSNLWKEAIKSEQIPDNSLIEKELNKLKNTSLEFKDNNVVKRVGEGQIDLGAIVKGYALDKTNEYLKEKDIKNYYVTLGGSSNVVGEYLSGEEFNLHIKNHNNVRFKTKNSHISTSGVEEQHFVKDDVIYSHIVNPITGSSVCEYTLALVIADKGYLSDVLSTAFMMMDIESIKQTEEKYDVKSIILKGNEVIYSNPNIEFIK